MESDRTKSKSRLISELEALRTRVRELEEMVAHLGYGADHHVEHVQEPCRRHYLESELYDLIKRDSSIFDFFQKGSLDGVWYWDLESPEHEWMSPEFWRLFGYEPHEKKHLTSEWQDLIFPEDLETAIENFNKHCADPNHPYDQLVRYRHKDGSTVWVRCRGIAIRDEDGKPVRLLGTHNDFTRMKEAENRWRFAIEGAQDGLWDWDAQSDKVYFSDQWKRMLGFEPDEIDDTLQEWKDRVHPDDMDKVLAELTPHLEGKTDHYENTHRVLCKDGTYKWVLDRGKVVSRDEQGNPLRVVGTHTDMTEQRATQEELHQIVSEQRTIFDNAGVGIALVKDRILLKANATMAYMFGYSPDEINNMNTRKFYSSDEECNQLGEESYPVLESGGVYRTKRQMVHKDGSNLWVRMTGSLVDKSQPDQGSIWIFEDISQSVALEQALRKSEELMRMSQEAGKIGSFENNLLTGETNWSDETYRLMGFEPGEVTPSDDLFISRIAPEHKEGIITEFERIRSTASVFELLVPLRIRNENIWLETKGRILQDKSGSPISVLGTVQDVTRRLEMEKEREESQNRFHRSFRLNPTVQLLIDPESQLIVDANDEAISFYGYSLEEMKRIKISEINILSYEEVEQEITRALKVEQNFFKFKHRLKNGVVREVESRTVSVPFKSKTLLHSIIIDVTDRNEVLRRLQTEHELLEIAEKKYRQLFESAPVGICQVARDGSYINLNDAHARLYGYLSAKEMLGEVENSISVFASKTDREKLLNLLENLGTLSDFESEMLRKDGSRFWTSRTVRSVQDANGHVDFYESFVIDITARKEAENASEQSRRQLLGVLEQLDAGVYVMNPEDLRIIYANAFIQKAIGKNLFGQVAKDVLLADSSQCPFRLGQENLNVIGDSLSKELLFSNDRWYLCTAKVSEWVTGGLVLLIVAVDVTEERQMRELKEHVDRIMRHDLRSPLNGIINLPEIILASDTYGSEDRELLEAISESGRKMLRLIDSSLSLYRLETGQYVVDPSHINISKEIIAIEREISSEIFSKKLLIEYLVDGRLLSSTDTIVVEGDRTLIPFLLSNLMKNAVEASPCEETVYVNISSGSDFNLRIRNKGAVPVEIRETFFEKYATCGKQKGTGLGTYSARLIARAHGGDILMTTNDEIGTEIVVFLPQTPHSNLADNIKGKVR